MDVEKLDSQWTARPPRTLQVLSEFATRHDGQLVWAGYKLGSKQEALLTLSEHSELSQKRHVLKKKMHRGQVKDYRHSETCVRAFCPVATCDLMYEAGRIEGEWVVKQIEEQSCPLFDPTLKRHQRFGLHAYQAKMFIPLVINRIEQGLPLTHAEIQNNLMDYVNIIPNRQFAHRVRLKALAQLIGVEVNYLRGMPQFIKSLNECGHRAKMVTKTKAQMMENALNVEKKRVEAHNKYQPAYFPKVIFDETRVRAALDRKMKDSSKYLYALLYVPKVGMAIFNALRPVFQTDATHCGNTSKSILFTMYAQDANAGRVLLGKMLVADTESEKTWKMFFQFIRESYLADWAPVSMISDQEKGCKNALKERIPEAGHFHCAYHRAVNVKKNCSAEDLKRFCAALHAFTEDKLEEIKASYSAKAKNYIGKVSDNMQYPVKSTRCLYGISSSSGVEGMNAANRRFRNMGMCRGYVEMIRQDGQRHLQSAEQADLCNYGTVPPKVRAKLSVEASKAMNAPSSNVRRMNLCKTIFEVPSARDPSVKYLVNMDLRTCSCGKWQTTHFPCSHVFRACRASLQNVEKYLDVHDSVQQYKAQYANCTENVVPPFEFVEGDRNLRFCAAVPAARGRPRKRRFKHGANNGKKRLYRCGRCLSTDHNIQSCPFTEGHIPIRTTSKPSSESENDDPVVLDSDDQRNERNITLPPGSSAQHAEMKICEAKQFDTVLLAEPVASIMGVSGKDDNDEIIDFTPTPPAAQSGIVERKEDNAKEAGNERVDKDGAAQRNPSNDGAEVIVPDSDDSQRRSVHSTDRSNGLLSGQDAPRQVDVYSSDEVSDDSDDEIRQRPVRLPLDEDEGAGDEDQLEGFNLRRPLELLMDAPVFQDLSSRTAHAEYGEEANLNSGDESDDGLEEAMDFFM